MLSIEEEKYTIRKALRSLKIQHPDLLFKLILNDNNIKNATKKQFYIACALSRLIKKNKTLRKYLSNDELTLFISKSRKDFAASCLYINRAVITLAPSHRLYKNREMREGYVYDNAFAEITNISTLSTTELTMDIVPQLRAYKARNIVQKMNYLKESSMGINKLYKVSYEAYRSDSRLSPLSRDSKRYVGVEIECLSSISRDEIMQLLSRKAPMLHRYLRVGYDGSISTTETHNEAVEFRFLLPEEKKDAILNTFQRVMMPYLKVNESCGLHVHLDMRNRNYARSFERLVDVTPILMSMVPKSRRENRYCKVNQDKKEHLLRNTADYRYRVINPDSYRKYRTLEVRVHSGTILANKIINWINLLTHVIDKEFDTTSKVKEPKRRIGRLVSFFDRYDIPASLRNYVTRRIAKFGRYSELIVPPELETVVPRTVTSDTEQQDEAS